MRKSLDRLYAVSGAVAAFSLCMIMLIVFGQVVLNTIDFIALHTVGKSMGLLIPSYAQFSGYALGFTTFLSLGLGFRKAAHIRVTLIEAALNPKARRVSLTVVAVLGVALAGLISYSLVELAWQSWQWGDTASGLVRVPLWVPQSVMALGAVIFLIAAIDTLVDMVRYKQSTALRGIDPVEEAM